MKDAYIICVDDEKIALDSLKRQLKGYYDGKFKYETAENAEEALELIDEIKEIGASIIIIVSDWLMPGIKGDDFLIRVHSKYPEIIKILLTGQADPHSIERARKEADLHSCLSKPWSEKELFDSIDSSLKKLSSE
jgi:CheY-like chemotaxis protein